MLPTVSGGTFIHTRWINPGGTLDCTSGFNFYDSGRDYIVTAKHCFKGENEADDETTNQTIYAHEPLQVSTDDASPASRVVHEDRILNITALATCQTRPSSADCILPTPETGRSGDFIALHPDSSSALPSIQTKSAVLPVLDEIVPAQGDKVCHYGLGSYLDGPADKSPKNRAEECGKELSPKKANAECKLVPNSSIFANGCPPGIGVFSAFGAGGDSGGPVYEYAYDPSGNVVGVHAVGIEILANANYSIYISIPEIESRLGVTLGKSPAPPHF